MKKVVDKCNDCIAEILVEYDIYDDDVIEVLLDLINTITGELHRYMKGRREGEY
jgi:hypothetical protein